MATTQDWGARSRELMSRLGTDVPPIAITFSERPPEGVPAFDDPMPPPTPDYMPRPSWPMTRWDSSFVTGRWLRPCPATSRC